MLASRLRYRPCRWWGPCCMHMSSSGAGPPSEWSDADKVLGFARQGPLFPKCFRLEQSQQPPAGAEWVDKGRLLRGRLGVEASTPLQSDAGIRIFHLYLPLYFWLRWLLRAGVSSGPRGSSRRCRVIGINAPQGAGKTTLVNCFQDLFRHDGLASVVLSIDDFYLTNREQQDVAAKHQDNPLLQFRGNAGTHDVALGSDTLRRCIDAKAGDTVRVPLYDKSLCAGRGDRAPPEQWPAVPGPIDVVLLEGWMLGFKPLPTGDPRLTEAAGLAAVNAYLPQYDAWDEFVDAWVVVQVEDVGVIHRWRLEAERAMRARAGAAGSLTDEQVADFVARFLPAYRAFLGPSLYEPVEVDGKPTLRFRVDPQRKPVG